MYGLLKCLNFETVDACQVVDFMSSSYARKCDTRITAGGRL